MEKDFRGFPSRVTYASPDGKGAKVSRDPMARTAEGNWVTAAAEQEQAPYNFAPIYSYPNASFSAPIWDRRINHNSTDAYLLARGKETGFPSYESIVSPEVRQLIETRPDLVQALLEQQGSIHPVNPESPSTRMIQDVPRPEKKELKKAEASGREGDALLGHLTPGDVIIPRGMVTPELQAILAQLYDLNMYTAGNEKNSINPVTGLPEFNDAGFDGGFTATAEADLGKEGDSGLGANPGQNGDMGFGQGLGGFMDALGGFFADPSPAPADAMDSMGMNGLSDYNTQEPTNPLLAAPPAMNFGSAIPALTPPTSPDVPDTLPQIGQYYALMRQGNTSAADNLLSQFMRGDKNVYGR